MQINTEPYIPQLEQLLSKVTSLSLLRSLLFLSLPFSGAAAEEEEEDEQKRRANEGGGGLMGVGEGRRRGVGRRRVRGEQVRKPKMILFLLVHNSLALIGFDTSPAGQKEADQLRGGPRLGG